MRSNSLGPDIFKKDASGKRPKYYITFPKEFKTIRSSSKTEQSDLYSTNPKLKNFHTVPASHFKPTHSHRVSFQADKIDAKESSSPPPLRQRAMSQTMQKFSTLIRDQKRQDSPLVYHKDIQSNKTLSDFSHFKMNNCMEYNKTNIDNENNANVLTDNDVYMINRRKYMSKMPSYSFMDATRRVKTQIDKAFGLKKVADDIRFARQVDPQPKKSRIQYQRLKTMHELTKITGSPTLSLENRIKIAILRTKIDINQKFEGESSTNDNTKSSLTTERRKNIYRSLLLEYHPDKSKHSKEVANEISNFLLNNKQLFTEGISNPNQFL